MKIHSEVLSTLILSALVFALFAGCGGGDKATNNFTPLPSTGTPSDPDDGTGGDVATTGFYVSVNQDDDQPIETKLHAFNSFSTDCAISSTTTTPTDLKCLLNIRELDLYLNQTRLEVNLAPGMCKYLLEQPYWYYNYAPGVGPRYLSVDVDSDAGAVTGCSAGVEVGVVAGGLCTLTEGTFDETGDFTCKYNYNKTDPDAPNCCTGSYSFTMNTLASGTTTTTSTSGTYPGKIGACANGPAIRGMSTTRLGQNWPVSAQTGLPRLQLTYVPQTAGLNKYTDVPAGIEVNTGAWSNIYSANMYAWTDYVAGTHSTATLPAAVSYGTDYSGSSVTEPNPAYTFICSDNGYDVKHRIRVYINEWDTNENYDSYISSSGSTAYSPNVVSTDVEGVDCATSTTVPGLSYCDDFWDWDQISANSLSLDDPLGFPREYLE